MSAADNHPHARKHVLAAGDPAGVDVGMQMIDGHQRFAECDAERLGGDQTDQQRAGQSGRVGHGNRRQISQPRPLHGATLRRSPE